MSADVEVNPAGDASDAGESADLPDHPVVSAGSAEEVGLPQPALQVVPDAVLSLEVVPEIEQDLPVPGGFHRRQEDPELPTQCIRLRTGPAVPGQLEVDRRRERLPVRRCHEEKVSGLRPARGTQAVEVVSAALQTGPVRADPVEAEPSILKSLPSVALR